MSDELKKLGLEKQAGHEYTKTFDHLIYDDELEKLREQLKKELVQWSVDITNHDDPSKKAQIAVNSDGSIKISLIEESEYDENEGKSYYIRLAVNALDEDEAVLKEASIFNNAILRCLYYDFEAEIEEYLDILKFDKSVTISKRYRPGVRMSRSEARNFRKEVLDDLYKLNMGVDVSANDTFIGVLGTMDIIEIAIENERLKSGQETFILAVRVKDYANHIAVEEDTEEVLIELDRIIRLKLWKEEGILL